MNATSIINLISAISPFITSLIQDAEGIFGSGSGQQKQQFVMGAVTNALTGAATGAQAAGADSVTKTINAVTPALGNIVNMFVAVANALGALPGGSTTPDGATGKSNIVTKAVTASQTQAPSTGGDAIPGFPTAQ